VIASNSVDRLVNSLSFKLPLDKVHATGLPRFAYMQPDYPWPEDLQAQRDTLQQLTQGRPLVVYAPTFRDNGTTLAQLLPSDELARIKAFCFQHGVVFGIRPHPYRTHELDDLCDGSSVLNLSAKHYPESAVLLQQCTTLVADYSSIWVDFLYQQRPLIGFTPDLEAYVHSDRGFVHEFETLFPGQLCRRWAEVLTLVANGLATGISEEERRRQQYAAQLLLPTNSLTTHQLLSRCTLLLNDS
jgi:CDP-glycerol glycerophosphotransferase (TagB/SpsB family)